MASKPRRTPGSEAVWKMSAFWGLGCICAELFLGLPVFPGHSEYDQVNRLAEEEEKLDLRKVLKVSAVILVEFVKISDLAPWYKNRIDCLSTLKQGEGWTMVDPMNLHQPVLFPKPTVVDSIGPSCRSVGWWRSVSQWWCAACVFNVWTQMFQKNVGVFSPGKLNDKITKICWTPNTETQRSGKPLSWGKTSFREPTSGVLGLQVLNMPPTSLLDAGRNTKRYFRKVPSNLGDFRWKNPWCWCYLLVLRAALRKCRCDTILKPRESLTLLFVFSLFILFSVMVVVGRSPLKVLECQIHREKTSWNCKLPMSPEVSFWTTPVPNVCILRKGPFTTERFTHQCEAAGMFTVWTSCRPLFFLPCAHILFVFSGGLWGKNPTSNWPNHQHGGGVAYQNAAGGIEASRRRWRCFLAGETPLNLLVEKGCCCKMVSMGTIFNRILYEGQRDLNHRYFYNRSCIWTGKCCWELQALRWKWYTLEDTFREWRFNSNSWKM